MIASLLESVKTDYGVCEDEACQVLGCRAFRVMAEALCNLEAEVAYLRRQLGKEGNWQDPEFGGCTPDPDRPAHLGERKP